MYNNNDYQDLVLAVVLKTNAEYTVAESENVFVGRILGVRQLVETQPGPFAVFCFREWNVQNLEELFQNRLLPQQLLAVAIRIRDRQIQRFRLILIRLQIGNEIDDVLQQARNRPADFVHPNCV